MQIRSEVLHKLANRQTNNDDYISPLAEIIIQTVSKLEMWANAQRDGRPVEYRWRPLFNAAKFG